MAVMIGCRSKQNRRMVFECLNSILTGTLFLSLSVGFGKDVRLSTNFVCTRMVQLRRPLVRLPEEREVETRQTALGEVCALRSHRPKDTISSSTLRPVGPTRANVT